MILRSLFFRPVLRRPLRFLVTVMGVAVGIASVIATLASNDAAIASFEEGVVEIAGQAKLEITRLGGMDENILGQLREIARYAVIVPVMEDIALVPALGDTVRVLGVDLLVDRKVRDLRIHEEEQLPDEYMQLVLKGEGAILPLDLANELNVAPGDRFRMSVQSRIIDIPVVALFQPERFASAWDRVVVVDVAWAQELLNRIGLLDRIEFRPRAGVNLIELEERVRAAVPPDVEILEPAERGQQTGRMVRSLRFNLTALSGISLLVGAVLVATTLYTSVIQRRSIIALLRSLGATKKQIAHAVWLEAAAIGLLGGVIGIVMGWAGARAALASVRQTVSAVVQGIPETQIQLSSTYILLGLALGFLVALAASALPLREAMETPPIQELRSEKPERLHRRGYLQALVLILILLVIAGGLLLMPPIDDLPYAALAASLALLIALLVLSSPLIDLLARLFNLPFMHAAGTPLRLAAVALSAGRRRAAWAAGAIGVATALAIAVATMVDSFRQTMIDWSNQSMKADIWIRPMAANTGVQVGRLNPEIVEICLEMFGPEVVDPFHTTTAYYEGEPLELAAGNLSVVKNFGGVPFRSGRDSKEVFEETLVEHGAIVNESFANRFDVGEGDRIRIGMPGGEIEREVKGVFYDYSSQRGLIIIDRQDFLQYFPQESPRGISLFLPETVDPAQVREQLREAFQGRYTVDILLNRDLREQVIQVFERTFAITKALQMVSSVVAVIAVLTVLFTLVSERRQDLALLRSLGASRLQVGSVVVSEAGLLGLTGTLSGLMVGVMVGWVLVRIVNLQSFGWSLQFLFPWSTLLEILLWVVPASIIAGLLPAWAATRLHPGEVLRDEA